LLRRARGPSSWQLHERRWCALAGPASLPACASAQVSAAWRSGPPAAGSILHRKRKAVSRVGCSLAATHNEAVASSWQNGIQIPALTLGNGVPRRPRGQSAVGGSDGYFRQGHAARAPPTQVPAVFGRQRLGERESGRNCVAASSSRGRQCPHQSVTSNGSIDGPRH